MPDDSLPQPPFIWEEAALKYGADLERVRVWNAFSEFFLDTELDSNDLDRIAEILADSPFSIEELKHIYDKEVSPVCSWNLLLIAGEWAGFNEDWLIPKCKKQQMKHRFDPNNKKGIFGRILDTHVDAITIVDFIFLKTTVSLLDNVMNQLASNFWFQNSFIQKLELESRFFSGKGNFLRAEKLFAWKLMLTKIFHNHEKPFLSGRIS